MKSFVKLDNFCQVSFFLGEVQVLNLDILESNIFRKWRQSSLFDGLGFKVNVGPHKCVS